MKPGIGLIGRKLGMTQIFREDGRPVPVSVLEAGPCTVVQAKTVQKDGYKAVQLGFDETDAKELTKPLQGKFTKANVSAKKVLKEFRIPEDQEFAVGSKVSVELFKAGDRVDVTGISLGKGFQGGMARWHWQGGPETHGSMSHRRPGSIGSSTTPARVFKGHHLPGRMGNERVTTEALEVVRVDAERNLLLVRGSVPGYDKGVVVIRKSRKPPKVYHAPSHPSAKKKAAAPAAKAGAPLAAKGGAAPAAKAGGKK